LTAAPTTGAASLTAALPKLTAVDHHERSSSPNLLAISFLAASAATLSPAWRASDPKDLTVSQNERSSSLL